MTSKEALSDLSFLAIEDENHTIKCKETIEKDLEELEEHRKIEEESGIDLTLIQRLKREAWIIREDGVIFEVIGINSNADNALILYNEDNQEMYTSDLYLYDYGKTWALTKEELENE